MPNLRSAIVALFSSFLLSACAASGDADLGPDPGGGFYDGPNMNVGHVNPASGGFYESPYVNVGLINP
jgi:hypothetical protein